MANAPFGTMGPDGRLRNQEGNFVNGYVESLRPTVEFTNRGACLSGGNRMKWESNDTRRPAGIWVGTSYAHT